MTKKNQHTIQGSATESSPIPGVTCASFTTGVRDLVTIKGSVRAGFAYAPKGASAVPALTSLMLDQGTKRMRRDVLLEKIERTGTKISFSSAGEMLRFELTTRRTHLAEALVILGDELRRPSFRSDYIDVVRRRTIEVAERNRDNPDFRAAGEFRQLAYTPGYPNYSTPFTEYVRSLQEVNVRDLRTFHQERYRGQLSISAAGDISHREFSSAVTAAFHGWRPDTHGEEFGGGPTSLRVPIERRISMPGKTSVTVQIGAPVPLTTGDPRLLPFKIALGILGSGFTSRLVQSVREKRGLTYGIYASMYGVSPRAEGCWIVNGTFAPALLEEGLQVTRNEIKRFVSHGVTKKEVNDQKESVLGSYIIGLSTTGGMANRLISNLEEGKGPEYLEGLMREVENVTHEQVSHAITDFISPRRTITVIAGAI